MPDFEYDLRYLRAGIDQLESYLLSKDIYRTIGVRAPAGEPPYPRLTLGWLILALQRAQGRTASPAQQAELMRLDRRMQAVRSRWRVAWGAKARDEFRSRLNLWRDYLHEYLGKPDCQYDRYAYEVRRRVLLQLLEGEADDLTQAELEMLSGLDAILRGVIAPGEFLWEAELAPSFSQETFWYLYGRVPPE